MSNRRTALPRASAAETPIAACRCRDVSVRYGQGTRWSRRCRRSTSRLAGTSGSRFGADPARARRRCCTCSAVSSSRPRERSTWKGEPLASLDAAARTSLARPDRLCLPGLEPAADVHRVRERRVRRAFAASLRIWWPSRAEEMLALVGLSCQARRAALRALRGRGSTGRDRTRTRTGPGTAPLRRADRPPRLRYGTAASLT